MKPRSRASFHSLFTDLLRRSASAKAGLPRRSALAKAGLPRRSALAKAGRPIHWPITDNAVSQQRECSAFTLLELRERVRAFTLLEMLVVMGVIAILMALVVPAFTNLKGASDVTSAVYTIKGVLDQARTYAMANNTYTWVGFFEENVSSPTPGTAGTGRIVMSIVASKDGTDPTYVAPANLTASLIQVGKLTKIDNLHLATFPDGSGTGSTFDTRPPVTYTVNNTQIQYSLAAIGNSSTPFTYPAGSPYTFSKAVQFSANAQGRFNNSASIYSPQPTAEIGVEPTHGNVVPASIPTNVFAIQFGGVGADVTVYRK
jgi:prepilin-type N-terminal cleavage/methylation domain-containing protein